MFTRYTSRAAFLSWILIIFSSSEMLAQTNLETNAGIQFNFLAPGAANLGMGGAFLALADDATTAYTNPAGLTNIVRPEVHAEIRNWRYTHLFTDRGRLEGDSTAALQDGEAENRVTGLSFLSYVYPTENWSLALYRHELANFAANFNSQGPFLEETRSRSLLGIPGEYDGRLASLRNRMELEIVNYGVAGAYRWNPGFSMGVSLSYYLFSMNSETDRFVPSLYETFDFSDPDIGSKVVSTQRQLGDDSGWSINLGFLWKGSNQVWSIGGVYRRGAGFDVGTVSEPGVGSILDFARFENEARFHIPETFGIGITCKPTDAFRIAFDYNHIRYSDMTRGLEDVFGLEELIIGIDAELDKFVVDDANELHLGFEYQFYKHRTPLSVRVGGWYDPDHSLRFEGDNKGYRAIFRRRTDEAHYSVGIGMLRKKFQLDAAFDYSERISIASFSAVFRL